MSDSIRTKQGKSIKVGDIVRFSAGDKTVTEIVDNPQGTLGEKSHILVFGNVAISFIDDEFYRTVEADK